jgi:aryl-alcohol dehydrogenase-like predicted oxidoreductase
MTQRPEPYRELVTGATYDALDRLRALAGSRGISMAGLALAWLLADERVTRGCRISGGWCWRLC